MLSGSDVVAAATATSRDSDRPAPTNESWEQARTADQTTADDPRTVDGGRITSHPDDHQPNASADAGNPDQGIPATPPSDSGQGGPSAGGPDQGGPSAGGPDSGGPGQVAGGGDGTTNPGGGSDGPGAGGDGPGNGGDGPGTGGGDGTTNPPTGGGHGSGGLLGGLDPTATCSTA